MNSSHHAVIAGESPDWRARVADALASAALSVEALGSGTKALERIDASVSLVVVAAQTCDLSGVALCRRVRELPAGDAITVMFVSGFCDEMDRILAFENGADDFVTEPFSARELSARVRAILRRRQRRARSEPLGEIAAGGLRLDVQASLAELDGSRVRLTLREFEILRLLAQNEGRVVRREELLRTLDGESHASERLVDTHVKSIRRKLGPARDLIETVRGIGYRFDASAARD
jgi:two-component system phosphate regulon response regulator PhoB